MNSTPALVAATVAGVPPDAGLCFFLATPCTPRIAVGTAPGRTRVRRGGVSSDWSAGG
ncbi:hypothetical protein GCM10010420_50940 [Streptomyces glaucosporus]|uniref:Uncharacterized protein n=1 Tax=Streptomyces glaucosporus TaxID=284044 RepID=A0ABN3IV95_9ACTN